MSFIHDGQIVVPAELCKSRKPHTLPITGPLFDVLKRREAARTFNKDGTMQLSEYIFHRNNGLRVAEFCKSWRTACVAGGVGNMLFHDLRRSAARDMIRSGVPQSVAMQITGHKTFSIFNCYDMTAIEDMAAALKKPLNIVPVDGESLQKPLRSGFREKRKGCSGASNPLCFLEWLRGSDLN
jgi:integrase